MKTLFLLSLALVFSCSNTAQVKENWITKYNYKIDTILVKGEYFKYIGSNKKPYRPRYDIMYINKKRDTGFIYRNVRIFYICGSTLDNGGKNCTYIRALDYDSNLSKRMNYENNWQKSFISQSEMSKMFFSHRKGTEYFVNGKYLIEKPTL